LARKIQRILEANEETTVEDLVKALPNIPEKDIRELFETRFLTFYIEDLPDDPGFEIDPIGQQVDLALDQEKLLKEVEKLPSPHREVIQMSFGLLDGEELRPIHIAETLGFSKERVRVIKKEALEMLKDSFGGENPFV
jgi:DNA-directed RNA polymerase sigma subunit (sigma70/sigma32)